ESIHFDAQDYKAAVTLRIDPQFNQIPDDSDASIQTQGLLGGKYVGIGPGGSDMYLKDGGQIAFTQSAIVLESLVNNFFANLASKDSDSSGGSQSSQDASKPDTSKPDTSKEKQK